MQLTIEENKKNKTLNNSCVSIPKFIMPGEHLGRDLGTSSMHDGIGDVLFDSIQHQHPLINTWLVLSSISICFLSAVFFILPK